MSRRPKLVTVVIPVRGGEPHLAEQLGALAMQSYSDAWEVVIVDNGATAGPLRAARELAGRLPSLRVVDAAAQPGLNHARNAGARAARGDFLAYCDADDVVTPDWLDALVAAGERADLVGGRLELETINSRLTRTWTDWEAPVDLLTGGHDFLPFVPGNNCGVWAVVVRELPWDEAFRHGSSDTEWAWRAQLAGYRLAFAPEALLHYRLRSSVTAIARQYFSYGTSQPLLYRRFSVAGMPRSSVRDAVAAWRSVVVQAPGALRRVERRGRWVRKGALRTGRLVGSLRARVVFL